MFFILSKVLYFLIAPFFWIMVLLIWQIISKDRKTKKRLAIIVITIAILFSNHFLYRTLVMAWQPSPIDLPVNSGYSTGILLGGLSGHDKNNRGYFGDNADRFIAAANLYHQGIIKKIIVSGGTGTLSQKEPPEAFFLKTQLIANGIHEADILIESRSRNTYENGIYSRQIIDSLQLKAPYVLITSALHMRRSASVFKKAGINCIAYPCDYKVILRKFDISDDIVPKIKVLNDWTYFIKEMIGYTVYKLTGKA